MNKIKSIAAVAFAHWLRERKAAGFTRTQTASLLGVDRRTLSNWATGETTPSAYAASKIDAASRHAVPIAQWGMEWKP